MSRLLLGEPMYHSTFICIKQSLNLYLREVDLNENADENAPATKKNLLDVYADRDRYWLLNGKNINNFLDFLTK